MNCDRCGAPINKGANYCENCGYAQEKTSGNEFHQLLGVVCCFFGGLFAFAFGCAPITYLANLEKLTDFNPIVILCVPICALSVHIFKFGKRCFHGENLNSKSDQTLADFCEKTEFSKKGCGLYNNEKGKTMDTELVYKQLTNINIEEQRCIWDERGKGYYGEYLLFCELYEKLKGNCKILMNLNVPVNATHTTEIDLLLVHETGLYVFEIKHYKGTIYGDNTGEFWTQYFRTSPNNTFKNPMKQNEYHIYALRKMFPTLPMQSLIVFTSDECDIKVNNLDSTVDVCALKDLEHVLMSRFMESGARFSLEEIDEIFCRLAVYSQMKVPVLIDGVEKNFFAWIHPTVETLKCKAAAADAQKEKLIQAQEKLKITEKELKKKSIKTSVLAGLACAVIAGLFVAMINSELQSNNRELESFKQKFLHIDQIDNEYIDDLKSYVEVSDVELLPLTDDAVSFKASLSMKNDTYGVQLTEQTKYIVMTKSGMVYEYDMFGDHWRYYRIASNWGKGIRDQLELPQIEFYGISDVDDIEYIKITDVQLFDLDINRTGIKDGLEIELYSK